jgi:hypothetical protein
MGKEKMDNNVRGKLFAFCIVVYKEILYETLAYKSLTASLEMVGYSNSLIFIYDNTETQVLYDYPKTSNLFFFHNPSNPGISEAYNYMAKEAYRNGCKWIILLDQDTSLPEDAASLYIKAALRKPDILIKAPVLFVNEKIFSPSLIFMRRSFMLKRPPKGQINFKNYTLVNSGLMINLDLFFKVGGYNNDIKLDFADVLFIDKIKQQTLIFEILDFGCKHHFSNNETDLTKALKRYSIFLSDLNCCPRRDWQDEIGYFFVGILHFLKLTMKFKSLKFFYMLIRRND